MHISPQGMVRNSGPHFDQTLDQPFDRSLYFFTPDVELICSPMNRLRKINPTTGGRGWGLSTYKGGENMLIITMKENQTVLIGENIRIMVVKIRGKQVRLGIEAPPETLIHRGEETPKPPKETKA